MSEFVIEMTRAAGAAQTDLRLYEPGSLNPLAAGANAADPPVPADILTRSKGEIEAAGLVLYHWLAAALEPSLTDRLNESVQHSFYLHIRDTALSAMPWEILRWPKSGIGGAIPTWVRRAHHLSRIYLHDEWATGSKWGGPVRILGVVGCVDGDADVEPQDEIREILRGIQPVQRTVDLLVVPRPETLDALYGDIKRYWPHVLHFIGHGNPKGLRVESANPWEWKPGDLIDLGKAAVKGWRPRLVFLNACRTATSVAGLASMADAFITNGARASIAMQGNIKGKAAGQLAAAFYAEIAVGSAVDEAMTVARTTVSAQFDNKEAAYPALTLACNPSGVLPRIKRDADLGDYRTRLKNCPFLSEKMRAFVDQVGPRRQLCDSTWPQGMDESPSAFVMLRGGSGYGKTLLSAWLLDLSMRVGRTVRYVQVRPEKGGGGVDAAELLRNIWGAPEKIKGRTSPLMCQLNLDPDGQMKLREALDAGTDPETQFEKFRLALRQAAAVAPITIVLDEFGTSMDTGNFRLLWTNLLDFLGTESLEGVSVIVVLADDEHRYYVDEGALSSLGMSEVRINPLQLPDFLDAFRDYLTYRSDTPNPNAAAIIQIVTQYAAGWAPLTIGQIESRLAKILDAVTK